MKLKKWQFFLLEHKTVICIASLTQTLHLAIKIPTLQLILTFFTDCITLLIAQEYPSSTFRLKAPSETKAPALGCLILRQLRNLLQLLARKNLYQQTLLLPRDIIMELAVNATTSSALIEL
jgi:hypothetical protein